MGVIKNFVDALFFAALFYFAFGLFIAIHGHNVPDISFTPIAALTIVIYMFASVTNYRL